jgi:N-acyl-phosphatidylethanolamine-hydrolysing phospholipase D
MIQETWSSQKEKRRRIWVKLWQRTPTPQVQQANNNASTRNRRLRRSIAARTRKFKARQQKSLLASKRRFLDVKQSLGEQARDKMTTFRGNMMRHSWKSLLLTEPAQLDWFDSEGYPKAVRNSFGRFVNPWNSQSTNGIQSLSNFLQWRVQRFYNLHIRPRPSTTEFRQSKLAFVSTPPPDHQIRCTWLGHSTTLVELHGFTILTDPIFCTRTDPWPFGETRYTPAPCTVKQLPNIHVCVISHDHYDHLDQSTVLTLKEKVQYWAVPLKMSEWLQEHCDIPQESILEMTWWQSISLQSQPDGTLLQTNFTATDEEENGLTLTCAPAQHWCGRNMVDRNKRLWCSWVVQSKSLKYFFAGDTALPETFPLHRQIGDRLGPFDVAALPIGAYNPSYFMKVSHACPKEAVQIHKDLRSRKSMAIHWGTFHLSEEEHDEPPRLFAQAAKEEGIDFLAIPQGDCILSTQNEQVEIVDKESTETEETCSQDNERIEYG